MVEQEVRLASVRVALLPKPPLIYCLIRTALIERLLPLLWIAALSVNPISFLKSNFAAVFPVAPIAVLFVVHVRLVHLFAFPQLSEP